MRVWFAQQRGTLDPTPPRTSIGEITLGPRGFLDLLETELGLPPVLTMSAERIIAYRGVLKALDNPDRFYHRSFAVDPVNVARTLLAWRDQWFEAGWKGKFAPGVQRRLADMAEIESRASVAVAPGPGQRAQRALAALASRRTQIQCLTLLDDPQTLTRCWRDLAQQIGYELDPGIRLMPQAKPGSDLHLLQTKLLDGVDGPTIELKGDGSLLILRSATKDISARAVGELIRSESRSESKEAGPGRYHSVVLAERDGIIVDNALERSGLPRCGFQHYSQFRAVAQVLKLVLGLVWQPVNPHLLMQFLIHPLSPLKSHVRQRLSEAVAAQPGVGGRAWQAALAQIAEIEASQGAGEKAIAQTLSEVAYWCVSVRYAPTGAPIEPLGERTQRINNWLIGRLAFEEGSGQRSAYAAAVAQCQALLMAFARLSEQGVEKLAKTDLDRLVDEVTQQQPDPESYAEVGHVRAATSASAIDQRWNTVYWWDMALSRSDLRYPWSARELEDLAANGVELASVDQRLGWRAEQWLKPIVNAVDRLVLVIHDQDKSQHPLMVQIARRFSGLKTLNLDEALLQGDSEPLLQAGISVEPIVCLSLPSPRRWWHLPETQSLPERETESYSSLNKLFFSPHQWVLDYAARLRPGRAEDVNDDARLFGSLAHRLFEEFFCTQDTWQTLQPAQMQAWLDHTTPRLIEQEGAVLMEPGRGVERQRIESILGVSLQRLVAHLRRARITSVTAEHHERRPWLDTHIQGDLDLLLTRDDGCELILDAKWGSELYHGEAIAANEQLQLATYAYLRKSATGTNLWPYPAYYIITSGNIVAPDTAMFPDALVFPPDQPVDLAQLWDRAAETYRWRRAQLLNGVIEVNVDGARPTDESVGPAAG
ncbi:MAG: PD-(D/E)XK nuclease family protein, partial [Proteobacteria bacterium]|nr:PD-(D/E)XK nuclease family protein [Pseudomonadota bacterium]